MYLHEIEISDIAVINPLDTQKIRFKIHLEQIYLHISEHFSIERNYFSSIHPH